MAITNNRVEKQVLEVSRQKINNIRRANIIILKQPSPEKIKSDYESHIYFITTTT